MVAAEEFSDFLIRHFEAFAAKVHGDLPGDGDFARLGFAEEVVGAEAEVCGEGLDDLVGSGGVLGLFCKEVVEEALGEVERLDDLVKAGKDAATIKEHVAAMLRAERRGGEILVALAGRVKDLPVSKLRRKRWYAVAALTPKQFGEKLEREAKLAIAALDGRKGGDQKSPPPQPATAKSELGVAKTAQPKRPSVGPSPPTKQLSAWHTDEAGALSRELTAT